MQEIRSYGSVGVPAGNRRHYPANDNTWNGYSGFHTVSCAQDEETRKPAQRSMPIVSRNERGSPHEPLATPPER